MNFQQLDLNLLRVLAAIHRTGSVTTASRVLNLSQPATSNALARLRQFLGDELFVRSPSGLQPTQLCEQLAPEIAAHLLDLETLVVRREGFDPARSAIHWRVSLSDLGEILFMPRMAQALREQVPGATLSNVSVPVQQVSAALEAREIDMAIGILQAQHRTIRRERLFREEYMALASPQWKPTGRVRQNTLDKAQFSQARFVVVSPLATFHGSVEAMLSRRRLQDRIALRVRHFGAVADLVRGTDWVAVIPEMYARDLVAQHPLRMYRIEDAPSYEVHLLWHRSRDHDPAHTWMRDLVRQLFQRADTAA